jgi:pimeloyl-ACP methyl ester carboxylesterase
MRANSRSLTFAVLFLGLSLSAAGCSSLIGVTRWTPEESAKQSYANALDSDHPTSFTVQALLRLGLYEKFKDDPAGTLAELHKGLGPAGDDNRLFALAELSLLHARKTESQPHFLAAALYAYAFLVPEAGAKPPIPLDPRNRIAADIYNTALAMGLVIPPKVAEDGTVEVRDVDEVALTGGRYPLPFGELVIDAPERFVWAGRVLQQFIPALQFDVYGFRNRYRQPGIGAPLIASLGPTVTANDAASYYVGPGLKIPVTAFLRLDKAYSGLISGHPRGTLAVYTTDAQRTVKLAGFDVPLEYEPTSALAYTLKNFPVFALEIYGFLGLEPQLFKTKTGNLLTMEPYQRGKIPVVLVHGTASSPVRWAELLNEMNADPRIAQRYQFWIFTYNTGSPILVSAGILRTSLTNAVKEFDPEGKDPALRQMVVIGHSQGGLLTKLTAINSGTKFWDNWMTKPFEEVELKPETRELVRRSMFVTPLPFVKTVIFISTPQRGSYVSEGRIANWLADLVKLPGTLLSQGVELTKAVAAGDPEKAKLLRSMPRSVNNMHPSNPMIRTLASIRVEPPVKAHSIIPVLGGKPREEDDDGVVKFSSAHIEEAVSEKVITSGHSVQANPEAIEEIRRILLEHTQACADPTYLEDPTCAPRAK